MITKIYTDSSLDEKRGIAGIGIYIVRDAQNETISNWIKTDDNNYAELWAIYQASILGHGKNCIICTDSQSAIQYIKGDENPERPRTQEQYIRYKHMQFLACKIRKLNPRIEWTKGHLKYYQENAIGNSIADSLSKQGRAKYYKQHDNEALSMEYIKHKKGKDRK